MPEPRPIDRAAPTGPSAEAGPSDEALVEALAEGRGHALDVLVMRYAARVQTLLRHLVGDGSTAEDLTQDVFLDVYHQRHERVPHFRVWLFRVARNTAIDHLRRRATRAHVLRRVADRVRGVAAGEQRLPSTPDRPLARAELGEALEAALAELPEEQREVFVLREREGLAYDEIAAVIGCAPKTVSTRLHRARARLRSALAAYLEEPE